MIIGQLLLHDASRFERNACDLDRAELKGTFAVHRWLVNEQGKVIDEGGSLLSPASLGPALSSKDCAVLHVYGQTLTGAPLSKLAIPFVSSASPVTSRLPWRRDPRPAATISYTGDDPLPEAVARKYFAASPPEPGGAIHRIGTYLGKREGVRELCEDSYRRLERFREDVDWEVFEETPEPDAMSSVTVWVDPGTEHDLDGMVAEALTMQMPVVAVRTPINSQRLEEGLSGFLVPRDPNEITHAVLNALFKPEMTKPKQLHALARRDRFDPSHRTEKLVAIYRKVAGG